MCVCCAMLKKLPPKPSTRNPQNISEPTPSQVMEPQLQHPSTTTKEGQSQSSSEAQTIGKQL